MSELARLYAQIALLRRGPQDVPASSVLLALTLLAYFVITSAVSLVLPPENGPWLAHLFVDVLFTLAWYALLLRVVQRSERFPQTVTAVFGFQAVLAPLTLTSNWLIRRFANDQTWQLPVSLLGLLLFVWIVAVNAHIVKAALEWSMPIAVLVVIAQLLMGYALLYTLFPPPG